MVEIKKNKWPFQSSSKAKSWPPHEFFSWPWIGHWRRHPPCWLRLLKARNRSWSNITDSCIKNIAVVHPSVPSVARAGFSLHASIVMMIHPIPSGKHTKNYGKSPFFMGKLTINGHFQ